MAEVFGDCLADPRVRIVKGDVGRQIGSGRSAYDAILLDVDNGPEGLTRKANDSLYDLPGLSSALTALTPGGVLAVWLSALDRAFTQRPRSWNTSGRKTHYLVCDQTGRMTQLGARNEGDDGCMLLPRCSYRNPSC